MLNDGDKKWGLPATFLFFYWPHFKSLVEIWQVTPLETCLGLPSDLDRLHQARVWQSQCVGVLVFVVLEGGIKKYYILNTQS